MEKRILTSKEWKEIQTMQEQAKAKRQAQAIAQATAKKQAKRNKIKNTIKNAIIIILSYAIITGLLFIASNYIQNI